MSNRITQILSSEKSKQAVGSDMGIKIKLDDKNRVLPSNEINKIINVDEVFNKERQNSPFYRIISTILPVCSNPLMNISGDNSLGGFNQMKFLDRTYMSDGDAADEEDLNFKTSIQYFLKENDGWFGYYDPDTTKASLCSYFDMEPKRQRFSLLPDYNPNLIKNWEITVTYPYRSVKNHKMVNDGLMLIDTKSVTSGGRSMTAFGIACLHNLVSGDIVKITGTNRFDGQYQVMRLGLDDGSLKGYYFVIDVENNGTITNTSRFKKVVDGVESEYYFRMFKKIKTKNAPVIETDDYETYQAGFSQNSYNDDVVQVVFNEDIDVSNLIDNLGRPLSELYLTMIKTDSNGLFTNISSGIETPGISTLLNSKEQTYLRDIPVINRIYNGGSGSFISHIALETNVNINNNSFFGDLVEYNSNELKEHVLAVVSHRFNTKNRETSAVVDSVTGHSTSDIQKITLGPRQEGYFYSPHNLLKIRNFSSYIETGDKYTFDMPTYAVDMENGEYKWRDLMDIGFSDSDNKPLDYPFLNGVHYLYENICLNVRRQDPFAYWGLYHSDFPADPIGDRIGDSFQINTVDDDC